MYVDYSQMDRNKDKQIIDRWIEIKANRLQKDGQRKTNRQTGGQK